jgi:hypothetical protein
MNEDKAWMTKTKNLTKKKLVASIKWVINGCKEWCHFGLEQWLKPQVTLQGA